MKNFTKISLLAKMKIISISLLVLCTGYSQAQEKLTSLVPATPTTAALAKYAIVPVSMYTGLPTITAPLASLKGKDLQLDISLSYHASGVKVEEMASWVGLGWSLRAGGVITREVRTKPDESSNGFLFKAVANSDFNTDPLNNCQDALNGTSDFEPDVYYFTYGTESGKFMYDEVANKFVSIGKSRKIIEYDFLTGGWKIIAEDGTKYFFNDVETNVSSVSCHPGSTASTITGWYLSKIVNANKTDSIEFDYQPYYYGFQSIQSTEKFFFPTGSEACAAIGANNPELTCYRTNEFNTQRLVSVTARSGKVVFRASVSQRLDLPGDYSLQYVDVYAPSNILLHSYRLYQDYFSSGSTSDQKRLRLLKIDKEANLQTEVFRKFEYTAGDLPSRFSFAQDYWGYANGQTANFTLVPSQAVLTSNGPLWVTGANRTLATSSLHAQAGMLKRITYPTGGFTEFDYENHKVKNPFALPVSNQAVQVDASSGSGPLYQINFVVNSPPNILNGFNSSGGGFVNIIIDGITCDYGQYNGQASTGCAVISLSGPVGFTITNNLYNRFLPNGSYTLTLDFSTNTNSASWLEFYGGVFWGSVDPNTINNAPTGGFRVKRIGDFNSNGTLQSQQIVKYHAESDTTHSSALMDIHPIFQREVVYRKEVPCPPPTACTQILYCQALKLGTTSQYPVAGMDGSIKYSFVTVFRDQNGQQGKSTFKYLVSSEPNNDFYPNLPEDPIDWKEGLLLEQREYSWKNQQYSLVQETINTYSFQQPGTPQILGIKVYPQMNGREIIYLNSTNESQWGPSTIFTNGHYAVGSYNLNYGMISQLVQSISRSYPSETGVNPIETTTHNVYSQSHLNVIKSVSSMSNGAVFLSHYKYPEDYSGIGTDVPSAAIAAMKNKNMVNTLVEQSSWLKRNASDSVLTSAKLNLYKTDANKLLRERIMAASLNGVFSPSTINNNVFSYSSLYELQLQITSYDQIGNPLEGIDRGGVTVSIIWDDEKLNPIAVVRNAPVSTLFHTSFEDSSGTVGSSQTGQKFFSGPSYSIPVSKRPTGTGLVMTYWYFDGVWRFQSETPYNPVISKAGASRYDEIRVYQPGAQMTTYTYRPGVGVTTITDTNQVSTFYEYDIFGRMKAIRDQAGNLVTQNEYHLIAQQ